MKFWLAFTAAILFLIIFKIYIARGIYEATGAKSIQLWYTLFTMATFIIGTATLVKTFPNGIMGLTALQNFVIALGLSVIICELLLGSIFVIDDLALWLSQTLDTKKNDQNSAAPLERRRFIKTIGVGFISIPFVSFLYGITKGKYHFKVFEHTLSFSDLPQAFDGFKIVQFSDLHAGGFDSYEAVERGFQLIQAQQADLILFTGDLVNDIAEEIVPYKDLLTRLQAPYGKYSILGNHDYSTDEGLFPTEADRKENNRLIQQHQADAGFTLLNNANVKITKKDAFIRLLGVENWSNSFIKKGDFDHALENCSDNEFSVLMTHDPTHWEKVVMKHPKHIHLTLSGHTHGAQMGIESFGIKWSPVKYFYKYWAGLYKELNQYLYVNRGFGFMGFAGRIGIPPEITSITLKLSKK